MPNIDAISGALFTLRIHVLQSSYTQFDGARDGIDIWYMGIILYSLCSYFFCLLDRYKCNIIFDTVWLFDINI